jgi:hypothetical protein
MFDKSDLASVDEGAAQPFPFGNRTRIFQTPVLTHRCTRHPLNIVKKGKQLRSSLAATRITTVPRRARQHKIYCKEPIPIRLRPGCVGAWIRSLQNVPTGVLKKTGNCWTSFLRIPPPYCPKPASIGCTNCCSEKTASLSTTPYRRWRSYRTLPPPAEIIGTRGERKNHRSGTGPGMVRRHARRDRRYLRVADQETGKLHGAA